MISSFYQAYVCYRIARIFLTKILARRLLAIPPVPMGSFVPNRDVSIVVPTIDADSTLPQAIRSWLLNEPREVIVVTTDEQLQATKDILKAGDINEDDVSVLAVPYPSKRQQLTRGISSTTGRIIVLVDDDVLWPPKLLVHVLTCFEDESVGGVGTLQYVLEPDRGTGPWSTWQVLQSQRLASRNRQIAASNYMDGGVTCLSGRTAAYRSTIITQPEFIHAFTHDRWLGRYLLDSGDDTFITRWLIAHDWNMKIQTAIEAEIGTCALDSSKFLRQVVRWKRNSMRSALRSIFGSKKIWRFPYVALVMAESILRPLILMSCGLSILDLFNLNLHIDTYGLRLHFTGEVLRVMFHLIKHPEHYSSSGAMLLLRLLSPAIDLYCLVTLRVVEWGSRDI